MWRARPNLLTSPCPWPRTCRSRPRINGFTNAFVTQINPSIAGPAGLVYSTYLGDKTRSRQ